MELTKYMVIDVDGTMTDSGIYYDGNGNEYKKFSTKDAAGFFALRKLGITIIVLTGRECEATKRRMEELKVHELYQNIKDKKAFLKNYMDSHGISSKEIGYIGDDLNDLAPMSLVGFVACPSDACKEIKDKADYISNFSGGNGAVRDIIEQMLKRCGAWEKVIYELYDSGT